VHTSGKGYPQKRMSLNPNFICPLFAPQKISKLLAAFEWLWYLVYNEVLMYQPTMGVEPMTCRLRIGCSTSKLRWRSGKAGEYPSRIGSSNQVLAQGFSSFSPLLFTCSAFLARIVHAILLGVTFAAGHFPTLFLLFSDLYHDLSEM
jgi:hypothetical protein